MDPNFITIAYVLAGVIWGAVFMDAILGLVGIYGLDKVLPAGMFILVVSFILSFAIDWVGPETWERDTIMPLVWAPLSLLWFIGFVLASRAEQRARAAATQRKADRTITTTAHTFSVAGEDRGETWTLIQFTLLPEIPKVRVFRPYSRSRRSDGEADPDADRIEAMVAVVRGAAQTLEEHHDPALWLNMAGALLAPVAEHGCRLSGPKTSTIAYDPDPWDTGKTAETA